MDFHRLVLLFLCNLENFVIHKPCEQKWVPEKTKYVPMGEGRLKACPYDKKVTRKIEKNISMGRGLFEKSTWFTGGNAQKSVRMVYG